MLNRANEHEQKFSKAETMTYEELKRMIRFVPTLIYSDRIPYDENKKSILNAIIDNVLIKDLDKMEIFQLLFTKGYIYHIDDLLLQPKTNPLFQDPHKIHFLKFLYTYIVEKKLLIKFEIEKLIWKAMKRHDYDSGEILKLLVDNTKVKEANKVIHFIYSWMNSENSVLKIISDYEKIKTIISKTDFSHLKNKIHQMAEQFILKIELSKADQSIFLREHEKLVVEKFLCASRFKLFQPQSYKIHQMIQHKDKRVNDEFQKTMHARMPAKNILA